MKQKSLWVLTIALTFFGGACASMTGGARSDMPNADGHIANIAMVANEGEAQQGSAAATRATSADVRSFAQMMVSDHTSALNAARDTASRAGITPLENDTTNALRTGTPVVISNLNTYSGAEYDRHYMQYQIDLHQWLLNALDTQLIPMAQSPELKALLQTQRGAVASHLEQARSIRGRL
jgi:putative membrane protein